MNTQYWVEYRINRDNSGKPFRAGPYGYEFEAESQLRDIRLYEGVHSCRVVPETILAPIELIERTLEVPR